LGQIAINWLCVNDSVVSDNWLWRWFDWLADRMQICRCRYPAPKGRCHANHFFACYISL